MAGTKTSALTALTTPADGDILPIVDISDTTQAPTGSTKKITSANIAAYVLGPTNASLSILLPYRDARRDGGAGDRPINSATLMAGTDNTGAFNTAIAALSDATAAYVRETGAASGRSTYAWARPTLLVPPGRWTVNDLDAIDFPNLHIIGAGKDSTVLHHVGTGALFTLGEADTTPSSPYQGTASGFTIEGMSIANLPDIDTVAHEGSRTSRCIADYFCGSVTIRDCYIAGFEYGYFADAGGDFANIVDTQFWFCDVGVYLGPASDQHLVHNCKFYSNEVGLVNGGAQGSINDCQFIDSTEYHIIRESNTLTRGSSTISGVGYDERPIEIDDCWWEDNAGGTSRIAKACVYLASNTTGVPRSIFIHDGIVIAGGTTGAHKRAFLKCQMATRRIDVARILAAGVLDWWVERESGEFPLIRVIDIDTQDGYTAIPYWGNGTTVDTAGWAGAISLAHGDGTGTLRTRVASATTFREVANHDDTALIREVLNADGTITYGEFVTGAWRDRMKLDIEGAVWTFRPDSANSVALAYEGTTIALSVGNRGYHMTERTDPTAPAANGAVIYAKDNGAGKTQLMVRFATGAVQQIAIEP